MTPTPQPNIVERILDEFRKEFNGHLEEVEPFLKSSLIRAIREAFEACEVEDKKYRDQETSIIEDAQFNYANALHRQTQSALLKSLEG